jgi:4-amino-4-deoxy-L-arabinose transferase-like glycosyltransferase
MSKYKSLVLLGVLILAFLLRIPQLNLPAIGYHNMKENEYISMAKKMLETKNLTTRDVYFYNAFNDKKEFDLYPQVPFVAYQILLGYRLFGDNLWFPRLINILFMLAAILCVFYIAYVFTQEHIYSIASAILLSVLPLGVYFARNLQAESGVFFFMCLGNLLWLKFIKDFRRIYFWGFSFAFVITAAYKMAFLIGFLPLFLLLPYKEYFSRRKIRGILLDSVIFIVPFLFFLLYCGATGQTSFSSCENRLSLFRIFTLSYWQKHGPVIWYYAKSENFTFVYFLLFVAGIVLVWLNLKNNKSLFARYLRAWSIMIIPYFMVFNDYLNQHNYYQMPFLGMFVLTVVYTLKELSVFTGSYLGIKENLKTFTLLFLIIFVFSAAEIRISILKYFKVIYPGTDEVGRLLKGMTGKDEKFFIYTFNQGYAPCVYAERRCGWVKPLEEFKKTEEDSHVRYIVIYPIYFIKKIPQDTWDYISENYHVSIIGLVPQIRSSEPEITDMVPQIIVLKKDGKVNIEEFLKANQNDVNLQKVYKTVSGKLPFYIMKEK